MDYQCTTYVNVLIKLALNYQMITNTIRVLYFFVYCSRYSALKVTSQLTMKYEKSCKIQVYVRHLRPWSREGSLSCHTCCDTGPRVVRSLLSSASNQSPFAIETEDLFSSGSHGTLSHQQKDSPFDRNSIYHKIYFLTPLMLRIWNVVTMTETIGADNRNRAQGAITLASQQCKLRILFLNLNQMNSRVRS